MGKIQILDENLIKKIAAGEVVERPASVVKELVENSIDAEASSIRVAIKAGGKHSIVVVDDGVGMGRDDISMCVHRHATSKMSSAADLFQIQTLGFRGEALASIGAVAHLAIESRRTENPEGTRLVIEGGIEREIHSIGRTQGTTIAVRNLFFNTPARRKFLRHVDTEARHVAQVLIHLAAGYPSLGFELEHQDREVFNYAPASRMDRAADLLGVSGEGLLALDYQAEGITVEGVLAIPEYCGKSKGKQYLVVRGRPIHSRVLADAVYRGFGGLLPEGNHPVFMIWLDVDPRKIDVNVHPTKREIRLADERKVKEVIEEALRSSLRQPDLKSFVFGGGAAPIESTRLGESTSTPTVVSDRPSQPPSYGSADSSKPDQLAFTLLAPSVPKGDSGHIDKEEISADLGENPSIWQAHNQYIIVQIADGLLFVDQRAAHQRINYAKAMAQIDGLDGQSQQLLFPLKLEMGAADYEVFNEVRAEFQRLGFTLRDFGTRTVLVEAIPSELDSWGEGEVFYQLLNEIRDGREAGRTWREAMVIAYVRKTSVARGERLSSEAMKRLVEDLQATDEPHISPTGKPVMAKIRLSDIDKLLNKL